MCSKKTVFFLSEEVSVRIGFIIGKSILEQVTSESILISKRAREQWEDTLKKFLNDINNSLIYYSTITEEEKDNLSAELSRLKEESSLGYNIGSVTKTIKKIVDIYRNFYSHIDHSPEELSLKNVPLAFFFELYYTHKIQKPFNELASSDKFVTKLQDFYCEKNDKKLTRDAQLFILSFVLPKDRFVSLLNECKGYKQSVKNMEENQNETTLYYKKREFMMRFSKSSYNKIYDDLSKNAVLFLRFMSTASKVSPELDILYNKYGEENLIYNIQKTDTFTHYAVRYIEDRKLFTAIKFAYKEKNAEGRNKPIDKEEGVESCIEEYFPYYINSGNIFCTGKYKGKEIFFKLSSKHMKYIISHILATIPNSEGESYEMEELILRYIFEQYQQKLELEKNKPIKEFELEGLKNILSKKIKGLHNKFRALLPIDTLENGFTYIKEIIRLLYMFSGFNTAQVSKEESLQIWSQLFSTIQQGYKRETLLAVINDKLLIDTKNPYKKDMDELCGYLQKDTHEDLLCACIKKLEVAKSKKNEETLETREEIEELARKYGIKIINNEWSPNFAKSYNFSLNGENVRKFKENVWNLKNNMQMIGGDSWYNNTMEGMELEFLFKNTTFIQEEDKEKKKEGYKQRLSAMDRVNKSFLLQHMAQWYYKEMTEENNITKKKSRVKIALPEDISPSKLSCILVVTIKDTNIKLKLHPTDLLRYYHILEDYDKYIQYLKSDLKEWEDKKKRKKTIITDSERLYQIAKKKTEYFQKWFILLYYIELHMVKEVGQRYTKKKDTEVPSFRLLVKAYYEKNTNDSSERKELLIDIRNTVLHMGLPKKLANNEVWSNIEGIIRYIAKSINCIVPKEETKQQKSYKGREQKTSKYPSKRKEEVKKNVVSKNTIEAKKPLLYDKLFNNPNFSKKEKNIK